MSFQPRARTPRDHSRRPARAKAKMKAERRRGEESSQLEEQRAPTREELVQRTLNSLNRLASQRFAVAPFYDHYDRWLASLRTVLAEFESSPAVSVDEQFGKERSQALSEIELALKERRLKEASREEESRGLNQKMLEARSLLTKTEREYETKMKELASQRERSVKPVAIDVGRLGAELSRIVRIRAGFFRSISKKTKAQKEAEAAQKLESTRRELAKVEQSFAAEQTKLRKDHSRKKQQMLEQISSYQKELDNLETGSHFDDGLDVRRTACDALINSLNALLKRTGTTVETTDLPASSSVTDQSATET